MAAFATSLHEPPERGTARLRRPVILAVVAALHAALTEHHRERGERAQLRRLRAGGARATVQLPFLVAHAPIGSVTARLL